MRAVVAARSSRLLLSSLLACRSSPLSMSAPDRLQKTLDAVSPDAAPSVLLTSGPLDTPPQSLVVLDSSFNPPTTAHMDLLRTACRDFGCAEPRCPRAPLVALAIIGYVQHGFHHLLRASVCLLCGTCARISALGAEGELP